DKTTEHRALIEGQRSREQIPLRRRRLVVVGQPEREAILNKRIFGERMRHLGGREVFAFSPNQSPKWMASLAKSTGPRWSYFLSKVCSSEGGSAGSPPSSGFSENSAMTVS